MANVETMARMMRQAVQDFVAHELRGFAQRADDLAVRCDAHGQRLDAHAQRLEALEQRLAAIERGDEAKRTTLRAVE